MKDISIDDNLQLGLHDSCLEELNINFEKKNIEMKIKLTNNKRLVLIMKKIRGITGIGYDRLNDIIILDYELNNNEIKLFTTLSEWLIISFDIIEFMEGT